jgi:MOSC domain-containing protein YiiM
VKEVELPRSELPLETSTFVACLATILEFSLDELPRPAADEDPATPGSALTMIEAEVCESFEPPLTPHQRRRNVVTRGIDLNGLVGRDFTIGVVRCRGMRLCEPCTVVQRYAARPVLRELVHRGGLRVDILADGVITVGDEVRASDDE